MKCDRRFGRLVRRAGLSLLALGLVQGAGCVGPTGDGQNERVSRRLTQDAAPPQPQSVRAGDDDSEVEKKTGRPIAMVNGSAITQRELIRLLLDSRGLALLQQMILRDVARQEVERRGLKLETEDIEFELDETIRGDRFDGDDPEALTAARREKLIEDWTTSRRVTREELAIAMERQACLRLLAAEHVKITEEMIKEEYTRVHGAKVEVRHIQLASGREFDQIQRRLKQGARFEDLVADYSQNVISRQRQGLLPPFSAEDPTVPGIFRKVAFGLGIGDVSNPIEAEGSLHVLKLERKIEPTGVPFEEARPALVKHLKARLIAEIMESLGRQLLLGAELRIEDPVLRKQYKTRREQGLIEGPALIGQ